MGLTAGWAYGEFRAPEYAATSYVIIVPGNAAERVNAVGFAQAYGRIATSDSNLARAQQAAGIGTRQLRAQVHSETSPDSPVIAITGVSRSPSGSSDIANAVAEALSVNGNHVAKSTGVQLQVFSKAVTPTDPASAGVRLTTAIGGCLGGLLGALCMVARPTGHGRHRKSGGHHTRESPPGAHPSAGSPGPSWPDSRQFTDSGGQRPGGPR
ncbi:lipopolysaccharide biosynthesis protein [Streptomyces lavendulae]|uniref:lipopolysaccharide biosynthesis protein n=1 Tax=Streptomyces lavendulae TaxID=1914 RepID=UPI00371BD5D1